VCSFFEPSQAKDIDGFSISTGRGRKAKIEPSDIALVDSLTKEIRLNHQNLDTVYSELNKSIELNLIKINSMDFLKKKLKYAYRRFRECIKKCQDPILYKELFEKLCQMLYLEEQG